jgi:peptidyl-tRNA hydrolase
VESIIKYVKSQEFLRIRVGICPTTPTGKNKKPKGEEKVLKFLLGEFKKDELDELKKLSKKIVEAVVTIYTESKEKAMSLYN